MIILILQIIVQTSYNTDIINVILIDSWGIGCIAMGTQYTKGNIGRGLQAVMINHSQPERIFYVKYLTILMRINFWPEETQG